MAPLHSSSDAVPPKVLATITDYSSLLFACRARVEERQIAISSDNTAHVAGLSDRRISQMLSLRTLRNIPSVRRVGILSLGPLLGVLQVKLLMVEDEAAVKQFGKRLKVRNNNLCHGGVVHHAQSIKFLKTIGKKGGKARAEKLLPKRRQAIAREAGRIGNLVRWGKLKRIRKEAVEAA